MGNSKKRWLRVLPNIVCLTLIFVMLTNVSVTTKSLPLSEDESGAQQSSAVLTLLNEAPELPELDAGSETEGETALPTADAPDASDVSAAPNASESANEQLSYSTLMSLNNGFYYYTYCNYNGQRHTIDLSEELQLHTFRMAQKYGVQYELVMAVMGVESGWESYTFLFFQIYPQYQSYFFFHYQALLLAFLKSLHIFLPLILLGLALYFEFDFFHFDK